MKISSVKTVNFRSKNINEFKSERTINFRKKCENYNNTIPNKKNGLTLNKSIIILLGLCYPFILELSDKINHGNYVEDSKNPYKRVSYYVNCGLNRPDPFCKFGKIENKKIRDYLRFLTAKQSDGIAQLPSITKDMADLNYLYVNGILFGEPVDADYIVVKRDTPASQDLWCPITKYESNDGTEVISRDTYLYLPDEEKGNYHIKVLSNHKDLNKYALGRMQASEEEKKDYERVKKLYEKYTDIRFRGVFLDIISKNPSLLNKYIEEHKEDMDKYSSAEILNKFLDECLKDPNFLLESFLKIIKKTKFEDMFPEVRDKLFLAYIENFSDSKLRFLK